MCNQKVRSVVLFCVPLFFISWEAPAAIVSFQPLLDNPTRFPDDTSNKRASKVGPTED